MGSFYATCLLFIFGALGIIARLHGFRIWRFLKYIKDELLIVLGTSSSETVLPRMMVKLERLGAAKPVVGLVIPAGYSFNLDGTSIYLTMAAVFIAQATNTPMNLFQQIALLAVLLLTSRRRGRDGQQLHRAGGNAVSSGHAAGCRSRVDSRHRPLHVGGAIAYECHRQRRGDPGRCEMDRRAGRGEKMNRELAGEVLDASPELEATH